MRILPFMKPKKGVTLAGVDYNPDSGGGGGGAVSSVNGQTGAVVLDAEDVGALPSDTSIPTKTSDLTNDSGFVDSDIIAPTEVTSTASQVHNPGNLFIDSNGNLYICTLRINVGDNIAVGTNCQEIDIDTYLSKAVSLNDCSTIESIFNLVTLTRVGTGIVGSLQTTNLKTLIGNPGLGNYVSIVARQIAPNIIQVWASAGLSSTINCKTKMLFKGNSDTEQSDWVNAVPS